MTAADLSMENGAVFLGHSLGETFPTFADSAITNQDAVTACKDGRSWAARHNFLATMIGSAADSVTETPLQQAVNPDGVDIPAEDDAQQCVTYMQLKKDGNATAALPCGPGMICNGFSGKVHFTDGGLDGITMILQDEAWTDALSNAITQLGQPQKQTKHGTLNGAAWKGKNYIVSMGEVVGNDLHRYIIVYFASYDRAFHDGLCKSCASATASATPPKKVTPTTGSSAH
jgi:hypothetical protein